MSDLKKGRDILADQVTTEPGVSDVGIEIRRGDERNKGVVSHGYARVTDPKSHKDHAKRYMGALIGALKAQPKPNLPKSELEKAKGAEKERRRVAAAKEVEARGIPRYKDMGTYIAPNRPHEGHYFGINHQSERHAPGVSVVGGHIRDKADPVIPLKEQREDNIRHLKEAPKPKLTRAELEKFDQELNKASLSEQIQAIRQKKAADRQQKLETHFKAKGQSVPEHLKNPQPVTLDYRKMKAEFKAKNSPAAEMAERNRLAQPPKPQLKIAKADAKVKIEPVEVSDPIIQNRTTVSTPFKISGPNTMSPVRDEKLKKCGHVLKRMIGSLQKVDPKTRLPGILLDKKAK